MWDAGRADFARMIAGMIETERAAGRAADGPDAAALAAVLLDLNDHALERHSLGSGPPRAAAHRGDDLHLAAHHLRHEEHVMTRHTLTFASQGTTCEAWHFAGRRTTAWPPPPAARSW